MFIINHPCIILAGFFLNTIFFKTDQMKKKHLKYSVLIILNNSIKNFIGQ